MHDPQSGSCKRFSFKNLQTYLDSCSIQIMIIDASKEHLQYVKSIHSARAQGGARWLEGTIRL